MAVFQLGSFDVDRSLGQGGMGEVWQGHHASSGTQVAIKVMTSEALRSEAFQRAFAAEVRAVASLDHPHVIRLYDVGVVQAQASRATQGRLAEGSPYLVMELAKGGNLSSHPPPLDWPSVRGVLLDLLAALAHAHARGVIHRDIKPGNVMWGSPLPGLARPRALLSDFGIAHAGDGGGRGGPTWGTPAYMAPERFTLEWRDLGPWTDLYSVGCLVFTLLRGRPPFKGHPLAEAMQAHLYRPVPALRAACAVPAGLDAWLRTMLAKSPDDRFPTAADAAWALRELGEADPAADGLGALDREPEPDTQPPSSRSERSVRRSRGASPDEQDLHSVHGAPHTVGPAETTWTDDAFDPRVAGGQRPRSHPGPGTTRRSAHARPPLPATWRTELDELAPGEIPGGGLRLFGLRVVRMVDRVEERDALWAELVRVHQRHRAVGVLLRGPVGCGKTRLAEWLCERALELGGATVLRADHGEGGGAPALARMVASALRVHGLGRRALRSRVQAWLAARGVSDDWVAQDIVNLASLGAGHAQGEAPVDLRATVRRVLEILVRDRPVIVHLDDAAWSATSIAFVSDLLEHVRRLPVMALLTSRDEVLLRRPAIEQTLRSLGEDHGLVTIELPPLPVPHRIELVRNLLGVEPGLAQRVARHTQGNPLFTVSLVRDWVARGLLVESPEGLGAAPGQELPLPGDLGEVWARRLSDLLGRHGDHEQLALELAAALGSAVDQAEWASAWEQPAWVEACGPALPPLTAALVDRLVDDRLAVRVAGGWRFVHDAVRADLLAKAQAAGRLECAHRACAAMVGSRYPEPGARAHQRQGRHLAAAGLPDQAAPLLLAAAEEHLYAGDLVAVAALLNDADAAVQGARTDQREGFQARLRLSRARLQLESGQPEAARRELRELDHEVGEEPPVEVRRTVGRARLLLARISLQSGLPHEAARQLDSARQMLDTAVEMADLAELLRVRGEVHAAQGQLDPAEEALSEAAEMVGALGREGEWARCVIALARVAADRGDLDHAEGLLASAQERCRARRDRQGEAHTLRVGGGVALQRGELDLADQRFRRAQAIYQRLGGRRVLTCRLGRARVAIARGQLAEGRRLLDSSRQERPQGREALARILGLSLLLAAHEGDWPTFEQAGEELASLLTRTGLRLPELHQMSAQAIRLASAAGEAGRANRVRALLAD